MDILVIIFYSTTIGFTVVSAIALLCFRCFRRQREYYVIIHRNIFYVIGLKLSRSVTKTAVIAIFVSYFTSNEVDLVMSTVFSNTQDSLSSILVILMANITDLFVGRYRTLMFSNTAYIGGLSILYFLNPYDVKWLIVIAIVLLSIGTSVSQLLDHALVDVVKDIDKSEDSKRSIARAAFWSSIATVTGAIFATITQMLHPSWRITFLICIGCMVIALLYFVKGYNVYPQDKLNPQRPLIIFFRVCRGGMKKLVEPEASLETTTGENTETKEDWVKVKSLLRLFPVWVAFFVVALISATGSTFFIEQYNNLSTNKKIPVQIYFLIQQGSSAVIPGVYHLASCSHKNEKVKIGVAMLCSVICCAIAWQVEVHRLKTVGKLVDQNAKTSFNVLWLVPQFLVLGCMEGLAKKGLLMFFKEQVSNEDLKRYGKEYIELVMGLGKAFTVNEWQLDKYYRFLMYVCIANFAYYCVIATFWFKNTKPNQDSTSDNSLEISE